MEMLSSKTMPKTALITGASSGIGYHLALIFAQKGYDLILVARRLDKLNALGQKIQKEYQQKAIVIQADLAWPTTPLSIYQKVQNLGIKLDLLVNNAGFGNYGFFAETDNARAIDLIQVNITSLTQLTKLFLADMLKAKTGAILNISSTAAFFPGPFMNTYFASKSYVLKFSVGLAVELKNTGVHVSCLCPGPTKNTEFGKHAYYPKKLKSFYMMSPEKLVNIAYRELMAKKIIIIPGLLNKFLVLLHRFFPLTITAKLVKELSGF